MFLSRLACRLAKATPFAGRTLARPSPVAVVIPGTRAHSSRPADGQSRLAPQLPSAAGLEDVLVPRKLAISPLESWLTAHYILPRATPASGPAPTLGDQAGGPGRFYDCPPGEAGACGEPVPEGDAGARAILCKNVLKIRRRKMNHHQYRKLIKRTRFVRRKVLEGRRRRKQIRFEKDLERIWKKAGLKEAPEGWHTPKVYVKGQ
ncbi:aurora kinase A-interacting protein [Ornithorhynchus anatinus]|uniref:aurora kinase A-interacting protein n=1 Tax=Ornithorhynchus anatinus TaxID=9258 RepID=UPI0000EDC639|nr:aurora kinase A-interacting protein [Ornithorhynchus anatinus]XP_007663393.1 aurora kinase A-interacting protein [Ornithorhynchus anatinus]XP_028921680.1 aurora kinase A-interacting protein [Ornithorhynchus anatinus]